MGLSVRHAIIWRLCRTGEQGWAEACGAGTGCWGNEAPGPVQSKLTVQNMQPHSANIKMRFAQIPMNGLDKDCLSPQ